MVLLGHVAFGKLPHEGETLINGILNPRRTPSLPFCQNAVRKQSSAVPEPTHSQPQTSASRAVKDSHCAEAVPSLMAQGSQSRAWDGSDGAGHGANRIVEGRG